MQKLESRLKNYISKEIKELPKISETGLSAGIIGGLMGVVGGYWIFNEGIFYNINCAFYVNYVLEDKESLTQVPDIVRYPVNYIFAMCNLIIGVSYGLGLGKGWDKAYEYLKDRCG